MLFEALHVSPHVECDVTCDHLSLFPCGQRNTQTLLRTTKRLHDVSLFPLLFLHSIIHNSHHHEIHLLPPRPRRHELRRRSPPH